VLRITIQELPQSRTLKLEGRLRGPWVEETERTWRDSVKRAVMVDLRGVTSIDERGKELLAKMYQEGADLMSEGPLMRYVVEEVTRKSNGNGRRDDREE
jgi:hypothetical protein